MRSKYAFSLMLFLGLALPNAEAALQVISANGWADGNTIGVTFNSPLDGPTAGSAGNYTLSAALSVTSAVLRPDQNSVSLTLSGNLPAGGATLTIDGVKDSAGNTIAANTSIPVSLGVSKAVDIGDVVDAGTVVAFPNGEFDVLAGGRAIWANADSFNFVYEERTGDFDVKTQIPNYTSPDNQARAGLMMRESVDPSSKNVDLVLYRPERQLWGVTVRAENGGATAQPMARGAPVTLPNVWVRMKRVGTEVTVYLGSNGFDWMDSFKLAVDFPQKVLVGMATIATEGATTGRVPVLYRNYGDMVYTNASITISQQPTNISVLAGATATFTVAAEAVQAPQGELTYRWQKSQVDIPGANGPSYTTPPLALADNDARFRVILSLPGASATSSEAVLTVTQDSDPPQVVSAYGTTNGAFIGVIFNETLDQASAVNMANYQLTGGFTVTAATLRPDLKSVALTLSANLTSPPQVSLTLRGVKDLSGNSIADNTTVAVTILATKVADIGDVFEPSTVVPFGSGEFEVIAGGRDIWGTDDSFDFIYLEKDGNFDVKVQVANFVHKSNNSRASLMLRETLETGSRNVDVIVYPVNRQLWGVTLRTNTFEDTIQPLARGVPVNLPNAWVRLRRNGDAITAYYGTNGTTWIDSYSVNLAFPQKVLVGPATTSNNNAEGGEVEVSYKNFSEVAFPGATIAITQQPVNTTAGAGRTATFSVNAQVTGAPQSELGYQWQKNGATISGASAASYTTPPLAPEDDGANFRVVLSIPGIPDMLSDQARLTVTQDSTPPQIVSAFGLSDSPSVGVSFSEVLDPASAAAPGNYGVNGGLPVTAAALSADQKSVALTLSANVAGSTTLTINGVKDLSGNVIAPNTSVQVTILGLKVADVGPVAEPSTVVPLGAGEFDVVAGGADIWGNADTFNFLYEEKAGDFDVKVQVTGEQALAGAVSGVARVSLMVRETLEPGSRNLDLIAYPVSRQLWGVTLRTETDGATAQPVAEGVPVAFPNVWLRLSRKGDQILSYYGTNGVDWIKSISIALPLPQTALVGMATVSANNTVDGRMAASYRSYGNFVPPPDTTPPTLSYAERDPADPTKVTVIFSEAMDSATANSIGNYQINNAINVLSAALAADPTMVVLTTSAISAGANPTLTVNGLRDVANNLIAANSQIAIEVPPGVQPAHQQDAGPDGLLVLEAEHYDSKLAAGGTRWILTAAIPGFSGEGTMIATPNAGRNVNIDISASPRLDFKVNFTKTGTHYVWVRGLGDSAPGASANDSVNVGVDGQLPDTSDRITPFPENAGYVWTAATADSTAATFEVATAGEHVINVWMREDGFIIDKLLITSNSTYQPAGAGPNESPRGGAFSVAIARSGNQLVITWSGAATLQSSDRISGGWEDETNASSPFQITPASGGTRFYRLKQ